jgi:signal transduction histidine kinase
MAALHSTHTTRVSPDEEAAQSGYVRDQFVAFHLRQSRRASVNQLLAATMVFALFYSKLPGPIPCLWFALIALMLAARFQWGRLVGEGPAAPRRIALILMLTGIAQGLPVLAFGRFDTVDRAVVSLILMAISTASVMTVGGYRGIYLCFSLPMLAPLALAWAVYPAAGYAAWVGPAMGVEVALYQVFLVVLGRDVFRLFDSSCRIRFAEHSLNKQLEAALEEARQAGRAKTRFLAAASHDLRQPLHSMGVLLAALGLRPLDERSREIVNMLGSVNQSLSGQLDGLLDISKLDAGIVVPDMQAHRLDQLVQAHVAVQAGLAQQKGLTLRAHCEGPVLAMTDAHLLQRVLGNLTSNALKFTSRGGVEVVVKVQSGHAIVEVVDTGMGIAPDHQQLIFQEFYQVSNPERDRSQGLGLGLAIVQRVCALLGIALGLESAVGQGSRFTLRLPLAEAMAEVQLAGGSAASGSLPSITILVVDDEVDVRQGMALLLEELGCQVLLADSVAKAAEQARSHAVDMVISDLRLRKHETGFDAMQAVRAVHPEVYVLLITGDTAPDRLQQAHEAGYPLLHKPVTLDALVAHIRLASAP